MGLGPQRKDSKTFGTTVYGLTHPIVLMRPTCTKIIPDSQNMMSNFANHLIFMHDWPNKLSRRPFDKCLL